LIMKKNNGLLHFLHNVATRGWEQHSSDKILNSGVGVEKRKYQRIEMDSLSVDVADGLGFFQGMVSDISRLGIRMIDLPKRLRKNAKILTIVVSGEGRHFKMNVMERWSIKDGARKSIGVEIINTPQNWTKFVMEFETGCIKDPSA
jgi:hypothetical protein